ncbi:MAG: ABC transporter ATP-binding protein [Proteobacteria bacterium]|nr:ABC transporter ATP-binding protein [Pseudomonadota bacterium]
MATPSPKQHVQIHIRNLCRSYEEGGRRHAVLDNLNADFIKGETVALRGRSGSGKSTLLNLISGIDVPDQGEIEVAGLNITNMSERDRTLFRREHIGFVYQAFNLVSTLSVSDNIRLVLELNGVTEPEAGNRIREMLAAVDLGDRAGSFPDVLSGGEQQRVAIARALVHRPSLLLADEPTGNLDDKTAEGVLQLLDRLIRQTGGTMIVATHSALVASYCDRVLELHNGALQPAGR